MTTHISKEVLIKASPERIYKVIEDPALASELNPNLTLLSTTPSPVGGFDNTWEYRMSGMKFNGETKITIAQRPYQTVYETTGGVPSTWAWRLQPEGEYTRVSLSLDYKMPGSFFGGAFNKLVLERQNNKDIETQLANLQRLSESN